MNFAPFMDREVVTDMSTGASPCAALEDHGVAAVALPRGEGPEGWMGLLHQVRHDLVGLGCLLVATPSGYFQE